MSPSTVKLLETLDEISDEITGLASNLADLSIQNEPPSSATINFIAKHLGECARDLRAVLPDIKKTIRGND